MSVWTFACSCRPRLQGDHGPKISVTTLDAFPRSEGYKTGAITYQYETKTFNYDRGIKLLADAADLEVIGLIIFAMAG